jgi:hypothetical protein
VRGPNRLYEAVVAVRNDRSGVVYMKYAPKDAAEDEDDAGNNLERRGQS